VNSEPLLVVLSGPSGAGKDSVLNRLRARGCPFHFTVTATTRARRESEQEGRDYFFLTEAEFQALLASGGLLEHASVYGMRYGVPKRPVVEALRREQDVIMRTDVQGARSIRALAPGAVLIFVTAVSLADLEQRLRARQTESEEQIARRLAQAREEMASVKEFDYLVVNREGALDESVESVLAIVRAEKCRIHRRPLGLPE
jgi:guanylate kinase